MAECVIVAVLAIVLLVMSIAQRTEIMRACDRRSDVQARLDLLKNEWDRKSLELARVASLERVDAIARTELGMASPDNMGIVVVDARPMLAEAEVAPVAAGTQGLSEPPTVLAGVATIMQQMAVAAVSNLIAGWFAAPPAQLPSVLR
jgi:cell division protein FtsL